MKMLEISSAQIIIYKQVQKQFRPYSDKVTELKKHDITKFEKLLIITVSVSAFFFAVVKSIILVN